MLRALLSFTLVGVILSIFVSSGYTETIIITSWNTSSYDKVIKSNFDASMMEDCTNGIDDDGDGLVDGEDPDCVCSNAGGSIGGGLVDCPEDDPNIIIGTTQSCNIIPNHEFDSNFSDWQFLAQAGASATAAIDNSSQISGQNSVYVDIQFTNFVDWHVELITDPYTLQAGVEYTYSFEARSEWDRTMNVTLQLRQAPWTIYDFNSVSLTTTPQTFTYTFTPTTTLTNVGLVFKMGNAYGDIWIDNVYLDETSCTNDNYDNYQWQSREQNAVGVWSNWTNIPGETNPNYDPGPIAYETEYRRLSRLS